MKYCKSGQQNIESYKKYFLLSYKTLGRKSGHSLGINCNFMHTCLAET